MPTFGKPVKKTSEEKKVIEENAKVNLDDKSPKVQNAIKNVTKISVELDGSQIERYLVEELDIQPDPVSINEALLKHSARQALYGMLHNIAERNYKDLVKEKKRTEENLEKYLKKKTQDITEELYVTHEKKGFKKPNKDQIQDAIDIYTDEEIESMNERIEVLGNKIDDAEQLKKDLYIAYEAFKAQNDDLITLSSNYRHDAGVFKGIKKKGY
ncbi:MAG: hypothetical protein ACOCRO_05710 [Halanaerobiales bacterium]